MSAVKCIHMYICTVMYESCSHVPEDSNEVVLPVLIIFIPKRTRKISTSQEGNTSSPPSPGGRVSRVGEREPPTYTRGIEKLLRPD